MTTTTTNPATLGNQKATVKFSCYHIQQDFRYNYWWVHDIFSLTFIVNTVNCLLITSCSWKDTSLLKQLRLWFICKNLFIWVNDIPSSKRPTYNRFSYNTVFLKVFSPVCSFLRRFIYVWNYLTSMTSSKSSYIQQWRQMNVSLLLGKVYYTSLWNISEAELLPA